MKSDVQRNLEKILLGSVKIMTTSCVYKELMELGFKDIGYAYKSFEKKFCSHSSKMTGAECIKSIIGKDNRLRFAVATQDKQLRVDLGQIAGVPLIYINRSVYILEPPSDATIMKSDDLENKKLNPTDAELKLLKITPEPESDIIKARKKKEPNPLSVKKKKKSIDVSAAKTSVPKKRKRVRKVIKQTD